MNLPDLGKLSEPRVEIELMDDEAKALLESSRCPKCRHLSIFHSWRDDEPIMDCKFCKEPCA